MNRFPFPPYRSGIPHWTERVVTYCAKVLPIVFDNSLSYYEFLGHLQVKLNEVIKALNSQNLVFVEFTHMIELELQNFEKYMEERQDNFEQQMQEEWQEFKTEMETAWNEFKTAMEQAWQEYKDEMDQAWADFKADMLQRFQTFQDTITAQQTAFEQHMQAVQQQFEDDMENRADTFEQTITDQQNAFEKNVETELEKWKDIAIRAILDTIRLELPGMISDVIGSDFLAPIITRQGFLKMISASNETATGDLDLTNEPISVYKNGQRVSRISTLADLASIQIEPGTAIVFTRIALFSEISSGRFKYRASDFPASGYTLSVGVYVTDASITTVFEDSKYSENTHIALDNGANGFVNVTLGRTAWQDVTATLQYVTIVFQADPATAAFTCDYSTGVELAKPPTADMVLEDQATGKRYTVEQAQGVTVDQQYDAQSANAQSGTAVAQALQTIPTVTVDQTFNDTSANAQSGAAIAGAWLKTYGTFRSTIPSATFQVKLNAAGSIIPPVGTLCLCEFSTSAIVSGDTYRLSAGILCCIGLKATNSENNVAYVDTNSHAFFSIPDSYYLNTSVTRCYLWIDEATGDFYITGAINSMPLNAVYIDVHPIRIR